MQYYVVIRDSHIFSVGLAIQIGVVSSSNGSNYTVVGEISRTIEITFISYLRISA